MARMRLSDLSVPDPAEDAPDTSETPPSQNDASAGSAEPPAEKPELTEAMLKRWRWNLNVAARAYAAAQAKAASASQEWARLVADARAAGVPERLLVAAAADADVNVPADVPGQSQA